METYKDLIEKFFDQKLVCSHGDDDESDTSSSSSSSSYHLPREIIEEIISRLPFNSVIRFQIVSKSWNAIIFERRRFSRVHSLQSIIINSDGSRDLTLWQSYVSAQSRDELVMDYSDFTMDHKQLKTLLPPDKHQVVWKSASLGFSIEQRTGKNCFMLGPTRLEMSSGEFFFLRKWEIQPHPQSRFSEVAKFVKKSKKFFIRGVLKIEMLSPETFYAAYLVFSLNDNLESTNTHSKEKAPAVAVCRGDGRMEMEIGEFFVTKGDNNRDIEAVVLVQTKGWSMRGLIVEGIEFRPSGNQITCAVSKID